MDGGRSLEKTEERKPDYARLHAKGTGVGAMLSMDTQFELSESAGGTDMKWEPDVHLLGQVGLMGQRVLQPIVNQQVGNGLAALDTQVRDALGGGTPGRRTRPGRAEEGLHLASPEGYSREQDGSTH